MGRVEFGSTTKNRSILQNQCAQTAIQTTRKEKYIYAYKGTERVIEKNE